MSTNDSETKSAMKYVLITGTSSGIGRATALHLDRQGMTVFAGVRDPADGQALAALASSRLHPVVLDIVDDESVASAMAEVSATVSSAGLSALVNDAGEAFPGPIELIGLDLLREQLEVNVVGQVAVTQAALPLLRQGRGRIVFVGSIGGKVALQFAGPYHASKYAIEAIVDSLRQELQPDGISVSVIEPGPISTAIWTKAESRIDDLLASAKDVERYRSRLVSFRETLGKADENGSSAEDVAAVIEKALTSSRPSSRYPVGASAHLAYRVKPFVPDRVFDFVARRIT